MSDMDRREALLKQDGYFIGIATFSLLSGMHFSPYFEPFSILLRPILLSFYITSPVIVFYLTSLLLAVGTVILAGVPVALFERFTGRQQSDPTSMMIWLIITGLLALPAFLGLLRGG